MNGKRIGVMVEYTSPSKKYNCNRGSVTSQSNEPGSMVSSVFSGMATDPRTLLVAEARFQL